MRTFCMKVWISTHLENMCSDVSSCPVHRSHRLVYLSGNIWQSRLLFGRALYAALHNTSCILGGRSLLNTWSHLKGRSSVLGSNLGVVSEGIGLMSHFSCLKVKCDGKSMSVGEFSWIFFQALSAIFGWYPYLVPGFLILMASQNDLLLHASSC